MSMISAWRQWHRQSSTRSQTQKRRRFLGESLEDRLALAYTAPDGITYPTNGAGLPLLHSYLLAPSGPQPAVAFMDFDGDTQGSSTYTPFDLDGNSGTFNAEEQYLIWQGWKLNAQYYSMFNVDVTTEQPNTATRKVAWQVFTSSMDGWGFSGIGAFPETTAQAFSTWGFGPYHPQGGAHEFGHNFGLFHTANYDQLGSYYAVYGGPNDELTQSIMGEKGGTIQKWGIYHSDSGASGIQDTTAILASKIATALGSGTGYKVDDYAGTTGSAQLVRVGTQLRGVVETLADIDMFYFNSTGGNYSLEVGRDQTSPVDLKVSVYDALGTLVASEDGDTRKMPQTMVNDAHLTLSNLATGKYYIKVESHGNAGDLGSYLVNVNKFASGAWRSDDVGLVRSAGHAEDNGTGKSFTLYASGSDIWDTTDAFHYLYQTLSGDGSITVRVDSMDTTDGWAKAGIMIRDTLDANSAAAYIANTPENGLQMSARNTAGGNYDYYNSNQVSNAFAPTWLRLTRTGNSITAYRSMNGKTWTQYGSAMTPTLSSKVYIGLCYSSHNYDVLGKAVYSNVSVSATGSGVLNPTLAVNGVLPTVAAPSLTPTATTMNVTWTRSTDPSVTGYLIERSSNGIDYSSLTTVSQPGSGSTVSSLDSNALSDNERYYYRVRTMAGSTYSAIGQSASAVTLAGAVTGLRLIAASTSNMVVEWTDASGETGYQVQRSSDGITFLNTGSVQSVNMPIYSNTGLFANTKYYYRVQTLMGSTVTATSDVVSFTTQLSSTPGSFVFTGKTSTSVSMSWGSSTSATSWIVERSSDNQPGSWSNLTPTPLTVRTFTDTTAQPLQRYYYRVTAISSNGGMKRSATIFTSTDGANALPSPWTGADVGTVGATGAQDISSGTLTTVASGSDVWGTADSGRFVYAPMTGDGTITARVASMDNPGDWVRAGVMMRETTATGSKNVAMFWAINKGPVWQWRGSTGGSTSSTATSSTPVAFQSIWTRITRTGNVFSASYSYDSTNGSDGNWTAMGSDQTITMASTIQVGVFTSAHDNGALVYASYDHITSTAGNLSSGGLRPLSPAFLPVSSTIASNAFVGPMPSSTVTLRDVAIAQLATSLVGLTQTPIVSTPVITTEDGCGGTCTCASGHETPTEAELQLIAEFTAWEAKLRAKYAKV